MIGRGEPCSSLECRQKVTTASAKTESRVCSEDMKNTKEASMAGPGQKRTAMVVRDLRCVKDWGFYPRYGRQPCEGFEQESDV